MDSILPPHPKISMLHVILTGTITKLLLFGLYRQDASAAGGPGSWWQPLSSRPGTELLPMESKTGRRSTLAARGLCWQTHNRIQETLGFERRDAVRRGNPCTAAVSDQQLGG